MRLSEYEWDLPWPGDARGLLGHLAETVGRRLAAGEHPVRFVVCSTEAGSRTCHCEVGILSSPTGSGRGPGARGPGPGAGAGAGAVPSIFAFRRRPFEDTSGFNVVLLVPTGINATIGGHAGDAGPV